MPTEAEIQILTSEETAGYATDPTLDPTADADLLLDLKVEPVYGVHDRPVHGGTWDAMRSPYTGRREVKVSYKVEIRGNTAPLSAVNKPIVHKHLFATGWVGTWTGGVSWVYRLLTPADAGTVQGSLWMEVNWGGLTTGERLVIGGFRGTSKIVCQPDQPAYLVVEGVGMMVSHTQAGCRNPVTAPDLVPPLCGGGSFLPYGIAPGQTVAGHVLDVEVDPRYRLFVSGSASCTAAQSRYGLAFIRLLGRGTKTDPGCAVRFKVEQDNTNGMRWWTPAEASPVTLSGACSYQIGTAASNNFKLDFLNLAIRPPKRSQIEEELCFDVEARALGTAGDDSITITALAGAVP